MSAQTKKKILIIGGGFAGVRTALSLSASKNSNLDIELITDKSHFEYHAALYRVVTGKSPLEVCIPLREIFKNKSVKIIEDTVTKIDITAKHVTGLNSNYNYDYIVLSLGSETSYFNIQGLKEYAFGFKSINEALKLKRRLHETFASCELSSKDEKLCMAHLVVVGGGASGVELAGELAIYCQKLAVNHKMDPSLVTVDLIEAAPRVLPAFPEDFSHKVTRRLHELGVNVFVNRAVQSEDVDSLYLNDMRLKTKTVIWTAGVTPNALYKSIHGLTYDKRGKVIVDEFLRPLGYVDVFVLGDAASTSHSGMAQTALDHGLSTARNIINSITNKPMTKHIDKKPMYAVPVGPSWAASIVGNIKIYGYMGWILRRLADFRFFTSILPLSLAVNAFRSGQTICESCSICEVAQDSV